MTKGHRKEELFSPVSVQKTSKLRCANFISIVGSCESFTSWDQWSLKSSHFQNTCPSLQPTLDDHHSNRVASYFCIIG
eukprot:5054141-Amphidinium_carterae.1